jgi:hypothetical protein
LLYAHTGDRMQSTEANKQKQEQACCCVIPDHMMHATLHA